MKRFILIDGSNYFYAKNVNHLRSASGLASGAIWGSVQFIENLYQNKNPDLIAIAFDLPKPTFRHQLSASYKANRPEMEDDLRIQIEPLKQLLEALGYPVLVHAGLEADDIIGTLAKSASKQGYQVDIYSADKDFLQLLQYPNVQIIDNDTIYQENDISKRFRLKNHKISATQIPELLALMGDKIDNIEGLEGVGVVTAAKWLETYGGLENILNNYKNIKGKSASALENSAEKLKFNLLLTTIKCDAELGINLQDLQRKEVNLEIISAISERFSLNSIKEKYLPNAKKSSYKIENEANLHELVAKIQENDSFSVNFEIHNNKVIALSLAVAGSAYFLDFSLQKDDLFAPESFSFVSAIQILKPIFENPKIDKICEDYKFLQQFLVNYQTFLAGKIHDVFLYSYIYNSNMHRNQLQYLSAFYLNQKITNLEDIIGKGSKKLEFQQIDPEIRQNYSNEKALALAELKNFFNQRLSEELLNLYHNLELPLSSVLAQMEARGVRLDLGLLNNLNKELSQQLYQVEQEIYTICGLEFNLQSPRQLADVLFERLRLPIIKTTPSGQASTDEAVLLELAPRHEVPQLILHHRTVSKLKNTYVEALPQLVDLNTNRLHTQLNQCVTITGRLSSSKPNLQNIPVRSALGQEIRAAFITNPDWQIISADYSQIELRILAHLSQDEGLINAFKQGIDIHQHTASEIFSIPLNEVSKEQRSYAKSINFGLVYGMGAFGLAKRLKIDIDEAQQYIQIYFQRYPKVLAHMENYKELARRKGYAETLSGRRIYIPDIRNKNQRFRQEAERLAINAPIQGSAADLIKMAMLSLQTFLQENDIFMLLQIHDELLFETQNISQEILSEIQRIMASAITLKVPLEVSIGVGKNWLEAH